MHPKEYPIEPTPLRFLRVVNLSETTLLRARVEVVAFHHSGFREWTSFPLKWFPAETEVVDIGPYMHAYVSLGLRLKVGLSLSDVGVADREYEKKEPLTDFAGETVVEIAAWAENSNKSVHYFRVTPWPTAAWPRLPLIEEVDQP